MDDITHLNKSSSLSKSINIKFVLKIVKPTKKSNVSRFDNTLKHYIKRSLLFLYISDRKIKYASTDQS